MTVRTRFAPSPTGLLHIGNARAALFNFLYARHHGGKFLLRIEDTDRERSTQQAVDVLFDGLAWMGITPDEEPVFQSTRQARHAEIAHHLLAQGLAYRCYCTPEELQQMRDQAAAEGRPPRYNGYWRDRDPSEAPAGAPYTVRIRAPREGETVIHDLVQGDVRVANAELDDMIILRGDGTPVYQLAVVVDDHDMDITHVIRGDDHLTNTFRQAMIYRAMGWDLPAFAHLPLIHGPDGAKLSKRHGAQSVVEFREMGYLPEALNNYLLRLGWGHGDAEILSRDEQIQLFDLDGVGRSASRMDYVKLQHLNGVWLRQADDARLTDDIVARLADRPDVSVDEAVRARILALMPGLKERAKTLVDLADSAAFLGRHVPLAFDAKAEKLLTPEARAMLGELARDLAVIEPFDAPAIDVALRRFAEHHGHKLGQVAQPLRAAMTGGATSPGIDATLAALGRDEVMARIGAVAR
ncbi:glutamyl-tRNA synthetase [Gluconacetobacter diazotrophicus PA1 5]|uniref:Glutamate--tRNA ligase 1 n=2 Tax=Gluconacetobacter diazotrophicus TaxID=33996 RepID=SYE1_GLUDA|nr:glutamate--tRNA ligase [Gluconacetobacter diazotrophicus]A9GZS1.1 RecName: Full=Glutamate--tRNA ligase 1; AltName: Full=Glutamyl-tRNA synthetase 1; Short=GluRS 1 [Gluconacetobacter diazotrophicus PA1 5]ACI51417.1 glutamyl-tRNA synthetase [Gluconacetobacter diazotrophicus PA1 5]MBB2157274.1 glutamate--tRNA ligase [Gluconacetobacter diazotrophicus]TWB02474.1 glutamyl-tRNA synthetase [Gluconacetobacter diazotrophicus]CAP53993.1 Glutamyl-tRNA synthetase I [Gluconacetobacter diazotrophicus PA1 5